MQHGTTVTVWRSRIVASALQRLLPMPVHLSATAPCCYIWPICAAYYRGAMGILLVYDVTDEASFNNIRNWMKNIETHASSSVNKVRAVARWPYLASGAASLCQVPPSAADHEGS